MTPPESFAPMQCLFGFINSRDYPIIQINIWVFAILDSLSPLTPTVCILQGFKL